MSKNKVKNLFDFEKFSILWISSVDKPRSVMEISKIWGYYSGDTRKADKEKKKKEEKLSSRSIALYQIGRNKPLWKEMIAEGYLKELDDDTKEQKFKATFGWIPNSLKMSSKGFIHKKTTNEFDLLLKGSIVIWEWLIKRFEIDDDEWVRETFFDIYAIKTLFNNNRDLVKKQFGIIKILIPWTIVYFRNKMLEPEKPKKKVYDTFPRMVFMLVNYFCVEAICNMCCLIENLKITQLNFKEYFECILPKLKENYAKLPNINLTKLEESYWKIFCKNIQPNPRLQLQEYLNKLNI